MTKHLELCVISLVDGGHTAVLHTPDYCEVRLPTVFLPQGVGVGSHVKLSVDVDLERTEDRVKQVRLEVNNASCIF